MADNLIFELNELVANEGEWGFLLALYLYPPDKSGGYAKAILSGFSF